MDQQGRRAEFVHAGAFASQRDVGFHRHDGPELILVEEGHCRIRVGDVDLDCPCGSLAILPGGPAHDQRNSGFVRTRYVVFRPHAAGFADDPRVHPLVDQAPPRRWLVDLYDLWISPQRAPAAVLDGLLDALLSWLAHDERRAREDGDEDPRLLRARRHLERHLGRGVGLKELCALVELSPSHLNLLFRRRFGCGAMRYHQDLRLARACELLRDPYLRVVEVARACGYDDANYFARLFRARHAVSPEGWRKAGMEQGDAQPRDGQL